MSCSGIKPGQDLILSCFEEEFEVCPVSESKVMHIV